MNRCPLFLLPLCAWWALSPLPAAAQSAPAGVAAPVVGTRNLPAAVQYGELVLGAQPTAHINGQAIRTAPGFRLFSPDQHLILAHTVQGKPLRVAYLIEVNTQWLLTAWILRPNEVPPTQR